MLQQPNKLVLFVETAKSIPGKGSTCHLQILARICDSKVSYLTLTILNHKTGIDG